MLSFRVKLLGSFVVVILIALTVSSLIAHYMTERQFQLYLVRLRTLQVEAFREQLIDYYKEHGDWKGVQEFLRKRLSALKAAQARLPLFIIGPEGQIVAGPDPAMVGRHAPRLLAREGVPLTLEGRKIGTLLAGPVAERLLSPVEQRFLSSVNRSLLLGGLVATIIALLLGTALFRQLTRPLAALTAATERIAAGDLEQRVSINSQDELGRLGEAFNRMAASLKRSEELRRRMIADIAHELRTPLTVLRGELEALQDGVFTPTPERIAALNEEVLLLNRLVEDLHELALAEAGELRLERGPTDLVKLLQKFSVRVRPGLEAQGLELALELPERLPKLDLDGDRIEQVLHNLVSNAARYTPRGGKVTIAAREADNEVRVSVADTGVGIPKEDLPHIFERFYRGEKSRSRRGGGAGLGLAIAKRLIELHGGRIWAESEPGKGTTITFSLPLGTADMARYHRAQ